MSINAHHVLNAIALGVGASLLMDAWNLFLKRTFGTPSLNYCLLGRWLLHMPEGTFFHSSIAAAAPRRFECAVGSFAHCTIGVTLGRAAAALLKRPEHNLTLCRHEEWPTLPSLWLRHPADLARTAHYRS